MRLKKLSTSTSSGVGTTGESGQALIETAITLAMLVVMLLGAVEIGSIAYAAMQVTNAARAAVQYGDQSIGVMQDSTGMQTAASLEAPFLPNLNTPPPTLSCVCADGTACSTSGTSCGMGTTPVITIHVTTSATVTPYIHLPGLPSSFTLYGQAYQQVLSN